jgi:hypothetical protein
MRLTPAQIDTIKSTAQDVLGQGVQVTLFGSPYVLPSDHIHTILDASSDYNRTV